jgi:uncharacterized membrane-anchored protein
MSQHSSSTAAWSLGTTGTSYIFLGCILLLVTYLSITRDATEPEAHASALPETT